MITEMPAAIRGQLIHGEIGLLSGPFFDHRGPFNLFRTSRGERAATCLIGFGAPLDNDCHAFYATPTPAEHAELMRLRFPRLLLTDSREGVRP